MNDPIGTLYNRSRHLRRSARSLLEASTPEGECEVESNIDRALACLRSSRQCLRAIRILKKSRKMKGT
jgi:hypothetical protein